jgi:uncharacterized damage-inducible protein DinB
MHSSRKPLFFVLGLLLATTACGGAGTPAPDAAQTPATVSVEGSAVRSELIDDWENQKETLGNIADAMPEEMWGFRPTPAQRTFGEQAMHIAEINVKLLGLVGGTAAAPTFSADAAMTKTASLQALQQSYDYGIALLNELTDAQVLERVDAAFMGQSTRARGFWFLLSHSMDTYGQMAVYLRLNGVVPPASRGV